MNRRQFLKLSTLLTGLSLIPILPRISPALELRGEWEIISLMYTPTFQEAWLTVIVDGDVKIRWNGRQGTAVSMAGPLEVAQSFEIRAAEGELQVSSRQVEGRFIRLRVDRFIIPTCQAFLPIVSRDD
jgi:hypothetical protein